MKIKTKHNIININGLQYTRFTKKIDKGYPNDTGIKTEEILRKIFLITSVAFCIIIGGFYLTLVHASTLGMYTLPAAKLIYPTIGVWGMAFFATISMEIYNNYRRSSFFRKLNRLFSHAVEDRLDAVVLKKSIERT